MIKKQFGRWFVFCKDDSYHKYYEKYWWCECDCGTIKSVSGRSLKRGSSKSCGCLQKEIVTTHGKSRSKIYKQYINMVQRCTNPNHKDYWRYGEKNILVCDSWLKSFESFYNDMGDRPFEDSSIERIDNSKGYSLENCKWATPEEQHYNMSSNIIKTKEEADYIRDLYKNGMSMINISKKYNCSKSAIYYIVKNRRWV